MNAKEKFTAKEIWKQRNSYHPNDLGRHYCEEVAKETALENTFVKGINPESVEDMRNALLKCLSYLADLNGSQWIDGDGAGEIDMRQRAKGLQQLAFDTLEKSKL